MHKETPTGYTAMHIAALSGHVNCLKVMIAEAIIIFIHSTLA